MKLKTERFNYNEFRVAALATALALIVSSGPFVIALLTAVCDFKSHDLQK